MTIKTSLKRLKASGDGDEESDEESEGQGSGGDADDDAETGDDENITGKVCPMSVLLRLINQVKLI